MPVGFSSAARNLFLLGSTGAQVVSNFFRTIDQSAGTDGVYLPDEIKYNLTDEKYILSGSASDNNSKGFGWFEKRNQAGTADWDVRVEATTSVDTTLRAMELDANDNLIVVGKTGDIPWIAKYSNGGVIEWSSTTNTGDVEYTGITSDINGNYYACGNTPAYELSSPSVGLPSSQAFVEKFDGSGNPSWGKSATMVGRDVVLKKCAVNSRGEVVSVGHIEDDSAYKGYIVKIDTTTGQVLWDRTISSYDKEITLGYRAVICEDVYIDINDQIYVVGRLYGTNNTRSFIIKYSAEGNIIWQKETPPEEDIEYYQVKSDGETEQTIVLGRYTSSSGFNSGMLSKYSKDGTLVWRRILTSSVLDIFSKSNFGISGNGGYINLDADPSFYHVLFFDQEVEAITGTPDRYTFGKVSSSGNGLGDFQYFDGTGETIDYTILNVGDEIGRLSDGSVRQDSSDLITYPFSPNKILFDDLATQVSNKKRQMDTADSFEYSGSPAIRPADFQELNLLGDVYSGSGNWLDQSGKGNDGVVSGATHNAAGYWEFDGVDDIITVSDSPLLHTQEMSWEFWIYHDQSQTINTYLGKRTNTSDGYMIFRYTGGRLFFDYGGSGSRWDTGYVPPNTEWLHFVFTRDSSGRKLYVNGSEQASTVSAGTYIPAAIGLGIGDTSSADNYYTDGRFGEVRIYPRALTAAQVFQNYNATKTKYLNEAPDIAPKISDSAIVYDSNLLLNYDFGNQATYDTRQLVKTPPASIPSTEQKITSSDGAADDTFGYSVAVGSDKIVVGARGDGGDFTGSAYIFDLDGNELAKITASDGAAFDEFGASVAVGSGKIVVGASYDDDNGTDSGSAYIFDLDGTNEIKITPSDGQSESYFGVSVAVGSGKIVVGADYDFNNGSYRGAAYIYDLDGTNEIKITASDGAEDDYFGTKLAVGSDRIVVAATGDDDNGSASGSAYIFDLDGNELAKITPSDGAAGDFFGSAVAVGSGRIVIGAWGDDDNGSASGSAYIFDLDGNELAKITASDGDAGDRFGTPSVAVESNRIVVGAVRDADNGSLSGSAYIFDLDGNELAKIIASDGAASDLFGNSVAVGSGKLVVGAYSDDIGSNSNQGSAYIYTLLSPPTTVKNLSSSSYTGTINGATFNPAGYFKFNNDGTTTTDWIEIPNFTGFPGGNNSYTYSFWMRTNFTGSTDDPEAVFFYGAEAQGEAIRIRVTSSGSLVVGHWGGAGYDWTSNSGVILSNTWYYISETYNGSANENILYVNGVQAQIPQTINNLNIPVSATLYLGRRIAAGGIADYNGDIGGLLVYNRTLTATEILRNFNATRGKYGV